MGSLVSDLADWLEDAHIERMLLERRPSGQTGFTDIVEDMFYQDEPETEEPEELRE